MKDYTPDKIRNVALVGHGSSGKTSLTSAVLFDFGATSRLTKVDKGNTVTDYEPEEIERKISINSAVCLVEADDHKINLVDTPGYSNFLWDTRAALRAVDGAAVLVSAVAGVEVGTEKVWEMLEGRAACRGSSSSTSSTGKTPTSSGRSRRSASSSAARPCRSRSRSARRRISAASSTSSGRRAYVFEKDESGKFAGSRRARRSSRPRPRRKREELVEMIAENDEKLMEKYLEAGDLSPEEVEAGLRKAVLDRQLFPVFAVRRWPTSASSRSFEGVIGLLPSPVERGEIKATVKGADGARQAAPPTSRSPRWCSRPSPTPTRAGSR